MLTFVIDGESHLVKADQFAAMVDVVARMLRDAVQGGGVAFTVGGLHASAPTIEWAPQPSATTEDLDVEFDQIAQRLEDGIDRLEEHDEMPSWMSDTTARHLYEATKTFGESSIDGLSLGRRGHRRRITRRTFRTLDRVLHTTADSIGSIEGKLVTATLNNGAHVGIRDSVTDRTIRCFLPAADLPEAGQLLGQQVTVHGQMRRDHLGRPERILRATVEPHHRGHVTVAEMAGTFDGPESVAWLREQRG